MILNRNDVCWCGSGKKYKKCHLAFDEKLQSLHLQGHIIPDRDILKNEKDIEGIRKSAAINNGALDLVAKEIKAGMTTEDINQLVHQYTVERGGIPATLGYEGYPKSACVSLNNIVCHGIPSENVKLVEGDIVKVDITTILDGYYADACRTFMIGEVSEEAKKLVEVAKECMKKGIEAVKPWGFLGDIGAAVQTYAHERGYSVVRDLGGHGIGKDFHEDPFVAHIGKKGTGMVLVPGMVFTVEPMINIGDYHVYIDADDDWTVYTEDDSLSAQWENTILVTETGVEILAW